MQQDCPSTQAVPELEGAAFHHDSGALPTYEEASNPNAPPPSYDSLFGRMKETRKTSTGILDFLKNMFVLLLGTIGCTIILGISFVVPVTMIVMGTVYFYDCPVSEYIPIYLIVGGIFGILKQILHLSTRCKKTPESSEDRDDENLRQSPMQTLISCFMLGWFIIGSVWVYKEFEPNYDPSRGKYCNKTLYMFSFWMITSVYVFLGVVIMCLCSITIACITFQRDS